MDFTERMLERNRSRHCKTEVKQNANQTAPLKEVHRNTVTTSTSVDIKKNPGGNKVTIETTVTMRNGAPNKRKEEPVDVIETTSTEGETESTDEKENVDSLDDKCPLRQDTKSKLQRLGVLYSDNPSRLSSPIHRTEERFLVADVDEPTQPQRSVRNPGRSARLAALAETINSREDDIRQHSLSERFGSKSPTKASVLNKHTVFTNKNTNEEHRKFTSPQRGASTRSNVAAYSRTPPRDSKSDDTNIRGNAERTVPSILKRTSPQTKMSAKSTKSIVWDKAVIDALEAQGFARSESNHRLIYDYDNNDKQHQSHESSPPATKPSPVKSRVSGSPIKATSPLKATSPTKTQSPGKLPQTSPVKGRYGSPIQMGTSTKAKGLVGSQSGEEAIPTMGLKQLRSPRKTGGSVLASVQRYEESTSPTKRGKDPAELTLAERLALFERNAGAAVLPKAPLALPVPVKKLQIAEPDKPKFLQPRTSASRLHPPQPSAQQNSGSTSSLHNRLALFEKGMDNSSKEHMKGILSEREKEMMMLKHRWDNHKGVEEFAPSAPPPTPPPAPPLPSSSHQQQQQYVESMERSSSGYYYEEDCEELPVSPQYENPKATYPVLKDVKNIKVSPPRPGCLYPCLSDMETESEAVESEFDDQNNRSSSSEMSDESEANSLGQKIVRISQSSLKRDWSTSDQSGNEDHMNDHEIDDLLDEALEDSSDEPTPPKRSNIGSIKSTSFEYSKSQEDSSQSNQPLVHTVSFYRKQQHMTLKPSSPSRYVNIDPCTYSTDDDDIERMEEELDKELKKVEEKIELLQQEIKIQQNIISQSSQALNLCYSTIEFSGSTEQLEAERLLLLANQRRQAALHEIQRLRVEQTIRPKSPGNKTLTERGSLTLSRITVPLRMDVVHQAAKDDQCYYLLCLVHSEERVLATDIMCAPRSLHNHNKLTFPNTLVLDGLYSDFKVTLEVYTLTARSKEIIPHDVKYHINTSKKDASKLKLTPRKGKGDSRRLMMPSVQSPGGPSAVRTSAFTMAGYVIFSLREIHRTQFSLNKNAYTSVLEGSMHLKIDSEMSVDVEYRGFLTMFEDISGFGAWHRRWCLLKGDKLSYWKYPDDEGVKVALDTIELSACTTQEVDVVKRDICARANTFLLETVRPARSNDVDSLVLVRNGSQTIIKHLMSADTREERIQWCQHLNKSLALMRAWGVKSK